MGMRCHRGMPMRQSRPDPPSEEATWTGGTPAPAATGKRAPLPGTPRTPSTPWPPPRQRAQTSSPGNQWQPANGRSSLLTAAVAGQHTGLGDPIASFWAKLTRRLPTDCRPGGRGCMTAVQRSTAVLCLQTPQRPSSRIGTEPLACGDVGGAEGTRTPDPLVANEVRYQLRHSPMVRTKR